MNRISTFWRALTLGVLTLLSIGSSFADLFATTPKNGWHVERYDETTGADLGLFANLSGSIFEGLTCDSAGRIYVCNYGEGNVIRLNSDGTPDPSFKVGFDTPFDVKIDQSGNVVVVGSGRTTVFSPTGSIVAQPLISGVSSVAIAPDGGILCAGQDGVYRVGPDYSAPTLLFPGGYYIAVDSAGAVYADDGRATMYKWTSQTGLIPFCSLHGNGHNFTGAIIDKNGNLVASSGNGIQRFLPDGSYDANFSTGVVDYGLQWVTITPAAQATYSVTQLDSGIETSSSTAAGINNYSQVVGNALFPDGSHSPFFYSAGIFGTPFSTTDTARAINDSSIVVGDNSGFFTSSNTVNPLVLTQCLAINSLGVIAGTETGKATTFDIVQSNTTVWTPFPGEQSSVASAIDSAGDFAGTSIDVSGNPHAYVCVQGVFTDLGDLGGATLNGANGMNSFPQVVGFSSYDGVNSEATIWDSSSLLQALGDFGASSNALAINSLGQVVGTSSADGVSSSAFVYDSVNGLQDLNTLIPANSGWTLQSATGINDKGEIVGYGLIGGVQHAFLLTPPAALYGMTLSTGELTGGTSAQGTATLSEPAGSGGVTINLSSSDPTATVPATVVVPQGSTSANFTVTTTNPTSPVTLTITASHGVDAEAYAVLTVDPQDTLSSVTFSPTTVYANGTSTGTVTMALASAPTDQTVSLSSSTPDVTVPATVTVPAGSSSATFPATVSSNPTATETATITASLNSGSVSANLNVLVPTVSTLTLSPTSLSGAGSSIGTATISAPAPSGGFVLSLSSDNTNATVPSTVTIGAGATTGTFTVSASAVATNQSANITASGGGSSATATLTLYGPSVSTLTLNPISILGGKTSSGTVKISSAAPPSGVVVSLASSNPAVTVPTSVTIAKGATTVHFNATSLAVAMDQSVTITATVNGSSATAALTVTAPVLTTLTLSPATLVGGSSSTGKVSISGKAPIGGLVVSLAGASPATVPASVTIGAGATSANFTVKTSAVSSTTTVQVTATLNGNHASANLTVQATALLGLSFNPTSIAGGAKTTLTATLTGPAPAGGATVTLSSSNAAIKVPASLVIAAGSTSAKLSITSGKVKTVTTVTVTASYGGSTKTATVTVH